MALTSLMMGALYVAFLIFIHDITAGDWKKFVEEPFSFLYSIDRWNSWSSRLFIENAVNIFSKNLLAWKVTSLLAGAVLFWGLARILSINRIYQNVLLFCIMLTVNLYILTTAGIFATTVNYLWPVACFVFVAAITLKPFRKESLLYKSSSFLVWPAYLFAMCSEQLAIAGLVLISGHIIYKTYKKESVSLSLWLLLTLSIIGILNVLLAPGNSIRSFRETAYWWPEFADMSMHYKLGIGAIVTFSRLLLAPEIPVLLLLALIAMLSYKRKNISAFFAMLPSLVIVVLFFFPATSGSPITDIRITNYFNEIGQQAIMFSEYNLPSARMIEVYLLIFTIITTSLAISLYCLYGRTQKTFYLFVLLSAGFATAIAVSFSPTIFASNTRTLYPFVMIIVGIDAYLAKELFETHFNRNAVLAYKRSKK